MAKSGLVAFGAALALVLCLVSQATSHGHSHDENPAFKYSRAANEDPIIDEDEIFEEDIVDLPPQRGHGHSHDHHGHSHDHHGHSHGGHGHSHDHHGHSHGGHGHSHGPEPKYTPEEMKKHRERIHKIWDEDDDEEAPGRSVWMQAIGATLLISAAPFFILFFIPLDNSEEKQWLLKIFLSFASGGLLGDAFLHLIPHAMMASGEGGDDHHGHTHSHGHSHEGEGGHAHDMTVGLGVLSGIIAFLVVEKAVRIVNGGEGGHGHSHAPKKEVKQVKMDKKEVKKDKEEAKKDKEEAKKDKEEAKDEDKKVDGDKKEKKEEGDKKEKKEEKKEDSKEVAEKPEGDIKVAGFLNLFADCFHNFTDGLAIGASFAAGETVGTITTLTILLHEVPHEIGDYAILIQSGVPPMKAIMLQALTAVGAMTGTVTSLLAQGDDLSGSSAFILPFTAGGFIYIATVSVIPDILDGATTFKQSVMEIVALLAGVGMMVIIAQWE